MPLDGKETPTPIATPATAPTHSVGRRRTQRYLMIAAGTVVLFLSLFFLGYFRGRGDLSAIELQNGRLINDLATSKVVADKALTAEQTRVQLLEARRSLDQAVAALDARNFGIAQQRLKDASEKISAAQPAGRLMGLAKGLEDYRLVATDDLGAQRQQLTGYLAEFDQLYAQLYPAK